MGKYTRITATGGISFCLGILLHAFPEHAQFVCLPLQTTPPANLRIRSAQDVAHYHAFTFDARELGNTQAPPTRCWFKITQNHKNAISDLLYAQSPTLLVYTLIPALQAHIKEKKLDKNYQEALEIMEEIVKISANNIQVWHFTHWLTYKRPLAIKRR